METVQSILKHAWQELGWIGVTAIVAANIGVIIHIARVNVLSKTIEIQSNHIDTSDAIIDLLADKAGVEIAPR